MKPAGPINPEELARRLAVHNVTLVQAKAALAPPRTTAKLLMAHPVQRALNLKAAALRLKARLAAG